MVLNFFQTQQQNVQDLVITNPKTTPVEVGPSKFTRVGFNLYFSCTTSSNLLISVLVKKCSQCAVAQLDSYMILRKTKTGGN